MTLTVIDLFCGAGGFSKGFIDAGCEVLLGIDSAKGAVKTYVWNLAGVWAILGDVKEIPITLVKTLIADQDVDMIIGSPPCQGFTTVGKRDQNDPRNTLFMEYLRIVDGLRPKMFIMENVPGILSVKTAAGELVTDLIVSESKKIGYDVKFTTLNAANYGVPQIRKRVFFYGCRDGEVDMDEVIPWPTNMDGETIRSKGKKGKDVKVWRENQERKSRMNMKAWLKGEKWPHKPQKQTHYPSWVCGSLLPGDVIGDLRVSFATNPPMDTVTTFPEYPPYTHEVLDEGIHGDLFDLAVELGDISVFNPYLGKYYALERMEASP